MEPTAVSMHMDAPAEEIYGLVADLPLMGRWSPECERCEWIDGATGATPGAKFKGYNRRGRRRWSTTGTIVTADRGRELAWDVTSVLGMKVARWRYRIDSDGSGACLVTESTEDNRGVVMKVLGLAATGVGDRATHNRAGMEATLARIKATVEAG